MSIYPPTGTLEIKNATLKIPVIDLQYTSNTAKIEANSNVVTEFPRSKKLIKYPRVAMTGSTSGGYTAQTSSYAVSTQDAWYAFDNIEVADGNSRWRTANSRYTNSGATPPSEYLFTGSEAGDWISIQLPEKMKLVYYTMTGIHTHTPQEGVIYGYDSDTSTWHKVSTFYFNTEGTSGNTPLFSPEFRTEEGVGLYSKYAMIVTKSNGHGSPSLYEWKLYGIPEYDPEAHGTDVTIKSEANVPNTDSLEVYFDAKNYTSGVVQDLSTNSFDGTLTNGASFNNSDGIDKFVFDGSNDYISGSIPSTFTGNQTYTFSIWVKPDSHPASGFVGVFEVGTRSTDDAMGLYFDTGKIVHLAYADNLATTTYATIGEWVHITGTYTSGDRRVYANGVLLGQDTYSDLTLVGTTFKLGSNLAGTQAFDGSIANFRLFNRALTTDEIYQLYAYQKEYFGHGDLSMTLKAGRLGIGTSEPRAALDVRGRIMREYNPGEIIETLQGKANGRYVKVQSGTYLLPNVGTYQDLTSTHTRINGSNFEYTPPPGTTRVIYEFWCFLRQGDPQPIIHFQGRVDGTIVNDSRHTYRDSTTTGVNDPQFWIYNHMCISISEVTSDNIAGGQVATWNGPRSIDFTAREYGDSHEGRLHNTNHWDGGGGDILVRPTIKITAIA